MRLEDLDKLRQKLVLPDTLTDMIKSGRWNHPGDEVLLSCIPFIRDPLVFLNSKESMLFESGPLMGSEVMESEMFSEYRGSVIKQRDLPWVDVEQLIAIICCEYPGDDVMVALDYRTGMNSPRVVGNDWHSRRGCIYHEISPSFDSFVELIGLNSDGYPRM